MKIEIKKVVFNERMSEETNCFVCDIYIDGKKVGYGKNDGHGGETYVQCFDRENLKIIEKCSEWCKTQPDINIGTKENPYMIPCSLEDKIDELFIEWVKEKMVEN